MGSKSDKKQEQEKIDWEAVGQRFAEIRHLENLKQSEMAEKVGCSITHYSNAERGKGVSIGFIVMFAKATGASLDYIMIKRGPRWLSDIDQLDPAEAEMVNEKEVPMKPSLDRMLNGLTPEHQDAARKCAVTVINALKKTEKEKH